MLSIAEHGCLDGRNLSAGSRDQIQAYQVDDDHLVVITRNFLLGYYGAEMFFGEDDEPSFNVFFQCHETDAWEDMTMQELAIHCLEYLY